MGLSPRTVPLTWSLGMSTTLCLELSTRSLRDPGPAAALFTGAAPADPRWRGPAYPGLISFAAAAGTATGLSLRSPRTVKIFFRDAGTKDTGCAGAGSFFNR